MKKMMMVAACVGGLACSWHAIKKRWVHILRFLKFTWERRSKYKCEPENYIRLEYDTLGEAAVLNFYKDEITSLDYLEYDENSCTFSFHKGETGLYRISWEYT